MAVVKEYKDGNCTIRIHDDYIVKTKEEVDQIMQNLADIAMKGKIRKIVKELENEPKDK